jgi:hypothetical protein
MAGRFKKHQHPPFFSEMRTFFKNWPRWYNPEFNSGLYQRGRFLKKVFISEKKGCADFFPGFVWWVVWAESPIQI